MVCSFHPARILSEMYYPIFPPCFSPCVSTVLTNNVIWTLKWGWQFESHNALHPVWSIKWVPVDWRGRNWWEKVDGEGQWRHLHQPSFQASGTEAENRGIKPNVEERQKLRGKFWLQKWKLFNRCITQFSILLFPVVPSNCIEVFWRYQDHCHDIVCMLKSKLD